MWWLGGTDQFTSNQTWYWVQTEQKINSGYTDWYRTEPDHPGIFFLICVLLLTCKQITLRVNYVNVTKNLTYTMFY